MTKRVAIIKENGHFRTWADIEADVLRNALADLPATRAADALGINRTTIWRFLRDERE